MGAAQQHYLDFGPAEHFALLHGKHEFSVPVALAGSGRWSERLHRHAAAAEGMAMAAMLPDFHAYVGQAGFASRRSVSDVRALPCAFVDLDYYKLPGLKSYTPEQLLELVRCAMPWLPCPTLLFSSGRGAYFIWVFDAPLSVAELPAWQATESNIIDAMRPYGADPAARDAARVLRIAGSWHPGANAQVVARQVGPTLPFSRLERAVKAAAAVQVARPAQPVHRTAGGLSTVKNRKSAYKLAQARMSDYRTLARLRGTPLRDGRKRLLYCYAQAAAWFCGSREQLERELHAFAGDCFAGASRYTTKRVGTVLRRFMDDGEGRVVRLKPQRGEGRYKFGNAYILQLLDVTPAEQRHLLTVIGPEEKARRRRERNGSVERAEYLRAAQAATQEIRAVAARLKAQGETSPAIARVLGVTTRHVNRLLKGCMPEQWDMVGPLYSSGVAVLV